MTQDSPELREEMGQALGRLGQVAPPGPGVLDASREVLWAAVAAEMLPGEADETGGARRVAQRGTNERGTNERETNERETNERETNERETNERETNERGTNERGKDRPGQAGRLAPGDPGA
jgi:hypothetical protein